MSVKYIRVEAVESEHNNYDYEDDDDQPDKDVNVKTFDCLNDLLNSENISPVNLFNKVCTVDGKIIPEILEELRSQYFYQIFDKQRMQLLKPIFDGDPGKIGIFSKSFRDTYHRGKYVPAYIFHKVYEPDLPFEEMTKTTLNEFAKDHHMFVRIYTPRQILTDEQYEYYKKRKEFHQESKKKKAEKERISKETKVNKILEKLLESTGLSKEELVNKLLSVQEESDAQT